mgnify:CR=1 FL=1
MNGISEENTHILMRLRSRQKQYLNELMEQAKLEEAIS